MKKWFLRHYLHVSAFLLGAGLTYFLAAILTYSSPLTQKTINHFHIAAIFGVVSAGISYVGSSIRKNDH
jgi:hypothetical protein